MDYLGVTTLDWVRRILFAPASHGARCPVAFEQVVLSKFHHRESAPNRFEPGRGVRPDETVLLRPLLLVMLY
jgi:hypothetical protein